MLSPPTMKKGFLKTEKARRKLAGVDVPKNKGKAKAKAESYNTDDATALPPRMDLHSAPTSLKPCADYPKDKNRFIFRFWPRDPNGKAILPSNIHGKEAGNGLNLWGATLFDFYYVRRIPSNHHGLTISTGSKLTKVMESFGELEHAHNEIAWAAREASPKEIPAWDPAQVILTFERRMRAGYRVAHEVKEETSEAPAAGSGANDINENEDPVEIGDEPGAGDSQGSKSANPMHEGGIRQSASEVPLESPFHPSHYPTPWPLTPFETRCSPFPLQRAIPIHLLPKKLYVHDPWKLVHVHPKGDSESQEGSWASQTHHVHTYTLSLPFKYRKMAEDAENSAITAEEIVEIVFIPPQETEGPTEEPAIRAFFPKRPHKVTQVPEAHLYLSPKGKLGIGNHSIVYEADLELPRNLFFECTYCKVCLDEQIKAEIDRLKETGEWEQRLNAYVDRGDNDATSGPSSSSVQIPPRYVGYVKVRLEQVPMETVDMVAAKTLGDYPPDDAPSEQYARVSDPVVNRSVTYEGLVVPLYPNIQWQDPSNPDTLCVHQAKKWKPAPRTATFRVAAKLSLPGDPQLAREASNYLRFPAHFFQHWNGYNVIAPLHDPTPVGALVPQFFGYYKPDDRPPPSDGNRGRGTVESDDTEADDGAYRSPILLLEQCGKPITASKLSTDDRHECAALLFRFHEAGWRHASFAERNILKQKRHPTCSPLEDQDACENVAHQHRRYSFRLIDFGRSFEDEDSRSASFENLDGKKLFGVI